MSKLSIIALIEAQFPNNVLQLIKPVNSRNVSKKINEESFNVKDGGFETEVQAGYKTQIAITDPKAWATKKYVDDLVTKRITDSAAITTIINPARYNDTYGNPSPAIGGIWNGSVALPVILVAGNYYIEPFGTDGEAKHKFEVVEDYTGSLTIIRIPYLQ